MRWKGKGNWKRKGMGDDIFKINNIGQWVRCLIALVCMFTTTRLLNTDIIAPLTVLSPMARDAAFLPAHHCALRRLHMVLVWAGDFSAVHVGCCLLARCAPWERFALSQEFSIIQPL